MPGASSANGLSLHLTSSWSDVGSVLRGKTMSPSPDGLVEAARGAILDLVSERADEGTTGLQPFIFEAYRRLAGDPDEHLATWLREGAPLRTKPGDL